jgi:pilus assembly protein CpaB
MNIRLISLLLVAVIAAGGAVFAASSWISAQRAELAMAQQKPQAVRPAVEILVARETLPTGTLLRKDHFRWQAWPDKSLAANYLVRAEGAAEALIGAVVRNPVTLGEPITDAKIVHPGERGFLAAVLKPDHRAITVGVIDQSTDDQVATPKISKNVTIEVTPKQAEMVTLISALGRLSLSLRSLQQDDVPQAGSETVDADLLLARLAVPAPEARAVRETGHTWDSEVSRLLYVPQKRNQTVKVVRGGEAFVMQFADGGGEADGDGGTAPHGAGSNAAAGLQAGAGALLSGQAGSMRALGGIASGSFGGAN